jgi:multimeric flavodoxin WrbA
LKVVAINGSPRQDGNTAILLRTVFAELERQGGHAGGEDGEVEVFLHASISSL